MNVLYYTCAMSSKFGSVSEINEPFCRKFKYDIRNGSAFNSVIVTSYPKSVYLLKLQSEQVLKEWTLKGSHTFSLPAVLDRKTKTLLAVTDQKFLQTWNEEDDSLEKGTKTSFAKPVQALLRCKIHVFALYQDGTFTSLERIKEVFGKKVVDANMEIIWSDCCNIGNEEYIVYAVKSQTKNDMTVYTYKIGKDTEHPSFVHSKLSLKRKEISSLSYCVQCHEKQLYLNTLWSNGEISKLKLTISNSHNEVFSKIPSLDTCNTTIAQINQSQVLVYGIRGGSHQNVGLGVWDTQFHVLQAFQIICERTVNQVKMYYNGKNVVLTTNVGMFTCSLTSGECNLSMMLGKLQSSEFNSGSNMSAESLLEEIFSAMKSSKEASDTHLLLTSKVTILVDKWLQKASSDKSYKVPYNEIRTLVKHRLLLGSDLKKIVPWLINGDQLQLIYESLCCIPDITESCIIECLKFYLSCEDRKFEQVTNELGLEKIVSELEHNMLSKHKIVFINQLLTLPFNDVFLLENLKVIPFAHVLSLLTHLHEQLGVTISTTSGSDENISQPTLLQIVEWISVVFDAHFTQMILSQEARPLLLELHQTLQNKVEFFNELNSLEAILSQLKEKCAIPQRKVMGPYCIETLYL